MIPITASPPTLLPQNVTRLARSKSVPLHPVHLTRTQSRRSASLPSVFQFKPLPPTPQEMPSQHVPPSSRPTFHLAIDASDPEEYTCPHNLASTDSGDPDIVAVPSIPVHPLLHNPSITEREASRRYHALAELLSTELGYLLDLRTLVSVYTPPSLSVPKLKTPLPGLSSSAPRFKKPFVFTTSSWLFIKSHHRLLRTPSACSWTSFSIRIPPHTLPPSSRWEYILSDFGAPWRQPPLCPRLTTFHSCENGKMYHASSILRIRPRRYHQKCGGDPRVP